MLSMLVIPSQALALLLNKGKPAYWVPRLYLKAVCIVFGIRYQIIGAPEKTRRTVFMSNHLSYLDIVLLGSILPASFLAKAEVRSWPLFGLLSRLGHTVYIERRRITLPQAKIHIETFLSKGHNLIIFPEGTSSSGMVVRPFKTGLFEIPHEQKGLFIQPVTIALKAIDGRKPKTMDDFNIYAWPLEMETSLQAHLWNFAKTKGAMLQIIFHPLISPSGYTDRKTLAKLCHDNVSMGLQTALSS